MGYCRYNGRTLRDKTDNGFHLLPHCTLHLHPASADCEKLTFLKTTTHFTAALRLKKKIKKSINKKKKINGTILEESIPLKGIKINLS